MIINDIEMYKTTKLSTHMWIFVVYVCPKVFWMYFCTAVLFATVDADFIQYTTAQTKYNTMHEAGYSRLAAGLDNKEENPQLHNATVFRTDSQQEDGGTTIFEAARSPTRLTNRAWMCMCEREGPIMNAFEEWCCGISTNFNDAVSWRR